MRTVFYPRFTKHLFALFICAFISTSSFAQMWNGQDTLYGNEWINNGQDYYRIEVSENGLYRIPRSVLASAGFAVDNEPSIAFQLFAYGQEVPMYASTAGILGANDYLEFYGEKHTIQMDQYLFTKVSDMMNPEYSVITDKTTYYLTLSPGSTGLRYQNVNNDLNNTGAAQGFYMHEESVIFSDQHVKLSFGDGVKYSHFDQSEGYASNYAQNRTVSLPTTEIVNSGVQSKLKVRFNTSSNTHDLDLSFNGNSLLSESFSGFQLRNNEFDIATNTLSANNDLEINGSFNDNDRYSIAYGKLVYPRAFNFNDQEIFNFDLASADRQYLEITNFNEAGGQPIIYDLTNNVRIAATYQSAGDQVRVVLPSGLGNRRVVLSNNQGGVTLVESLKKYTPVDFTNISGDYIIVSHPALMGAGGSVNYVNEYAQYRASVAGGGFDVEIINIEEIENQFGYGSPKHPQSMRNFSHWVIENWENPRYFFIIGKGIEYTQVRTETDLANPQNSAFYVPTWGSPGSDNLLLSDDISSLPVIPAGRMPASTPDQIKKYLDKVKLQEQTFNNPQTIADRYWMRRILHLSGGSPAEQTSIANALGNMGNVISKNQFGADVTTFYKTSTDPVQISESEGIFNLINDGVSVITFFGHSSVGTFDFNIDNPDNYENYGKYPLILSLGCYSGNIHTNAEGISERFTFYEDKGASAFIASTGLGYISPLASFGNFLYDNMGTDRYDLGVGNALHGALDDMNENLSFSIRTLVQQLTLNGDPALKFYNTNDGPDYVVDPATVSFDPKVLNAQLDSFTLNFDVVNLGRAISDSFEITIEQQLPNGERFSLVMDKITAPYSRFMSSHRIKNFGSIASGLNRFYIKVDTKSDVDEMPSPVAETNNTIIGSDNMEGIPIFIYDNSLQPIFPDDFAIVNDNQPVRLLSNTRNALLPKQDFIIELDTTELFNSPFKIRETISQRGGVVSWEPNINWENEQVYYWRTSPDSISTETPFIWRSRSFVYLADSEPGWNQSHLYQYKQNEFDGLQILDGEDLDYLTNGYFITIRNKVYDPNSPPQFDYNFSSAGSVNPWLFFDSGIAFFVADSTTGAGWLNQSPGDYGSVNPYVTRVFCFPTSTAEERSLVIDFVENIIPDKFYVHAFTILKDFNQDFQPELWADDEDIMGKSIFTVLEDQGANLVRDLETGSRPYTIMFRKNESVLQEHLANDITGSVVSEAFIPILRTSGEMRSTRIGPASSWGMMEWSLAKSDDAADEIAAHILGVRTSGVIDTLAKNISSSSYDLSTIDAETYPYLELSYASADPIKRTATDLINWRVTHEGFPDLAVNPSAHFVMHSDTLQEGDTFLFETGITNTSQYEITSSNVSASFLHNGAAEQQSVTIKNLAPGETTNVSFSMETLNKAGQNGLLLEANPEENPKERYRFNNFGNLNYFVSNDKTNPLLEVVFDGVQIMNGDIVSARPQINIRLKDENPFLSLADTSVMKLILTDPNQQKRSIPFTDPEIIFEPADGDRNEAYIEWHPTFEQDGDYQLIVQGEDITGNQSGALDYKVNFKIVNRKMISNVLNYPNPFSTSTRFVYTLTGDETPYFFKIQIFSATGRIVKEITQDELGPLKIGTHQTDYVWNGTDDFGDRLANGVYFYRVVTKNALGEDYESFVNGSIDSFFEQGFGKLVIMR